MYKNSQISIQYYNAEIFKHIKLNYHHVSETSLSDTHPTHLIGGHRERYVFVPIITHSQHMITIYTSDIEMKHLKVHKSTILEMLLSTNLSKKQIMILPYTPSHKLFLPFIITYEVDDNNQTKPNYFTLDLA